MSTSYENNDICYFKNNLSKLVKNHGVNVLYFNEREPYFKSITEGELAKWFKKMYLRNHFKWMKKNFTKQRDLLSIDTID